MSSPELRRERPDGTWVLLGIALVLLALRFVRLDLASFYMDEPSFLTAAAQQIDTGTWASRSPIVGNSNLHYGPSILWFYGAVQLLLGRSAVVMIGAMCATVTAAQMYFAYSITRAFTWRHTDGTKSPASMLRSGEARLVGGCVLLLLASSPLQYIWSRLAWDQLTDITAFAAVGVLAAPARLSAMRAGVTGVLLGIGMSSHPLIIPLVPLALILIAASHRGDGKDMLIAVTAFIVPFIAVNIPWLLAVRQEIMDGTAIALRARHEAAFFPDRWLEPLMAMGSFDLAYFFDAEWLVFARKLPVSNDIVGALGLLFGIVSVCLGTVYAFFAPRGAPRRIALMASAASVAFPVYMTRLGTGMNPHYQFPTGWVVPVLLAAALSGARAPVVRHVLVGLLITCAAAQAGVLAVGASWIAQHDGTRGPHYGTTVGSQLALVRTVCGTSRAAVIFNRTNVRAETLRYHLRTVPACASNDVAVCPGATCRTPTDADARYEWAYASSTGALATLVRAVPASSERGHGATADTLSR